METKASILSDWDDLVFERRNKSYGAYLLRKMYTRRLILGIGTSTCIIATLILAPELFPALPKQLLPPLTERQIGLTEVPSFPKKQPKTAEHPRPQPRQNRNTQIQVVSIPVEPTVEAFEPAPEPVLEGGTGDFAGGADVEAGNGQVAAPKPEEIVFHAEVMPSYLGGMEAMMRFLSRNLKYPPSPRRLNIEGTVFVSFVVNGDGSITHVNVIKGLHPDCDKEAVRVISMLPGWTGGKQNGIPVGVRMVLPIKFKLR
jgi:periplasmic protein TonB